MFVKWLAAGAVVLSGVLGMGAARAADVGVSIQISEPGVYGRIDIGRFPQPQVVVQQPVIVMAPAPQPQRVVVRHEPVYMWVPPGHRKNWRQHCGQYGACGMPVYFVRHDWYDQNVMQGRPHHQVKHKHKHGHGHGKKKHRDHDDDD